MLSWRVPVRILTDDAKLEDTLVQVARRRREMAEKMQIHPDGENQRMVAPIVEIVAVSLTS